MSKEFNVGKIVLTKAVDELMHSDEKFRNFVNTALGMHINCNWGKISPEDKKKNDDSIENGERLVSQYRRSGMSKDEPNSRIQIITEADRSVTTILFAEEN